MKTLELKPRAPARANVVGPALERGGPYAPDAVPYDVARATWRAFRIGNNYGGDAPFLTPPEGNAKLAKDGALPNYGLTLSAADASGYDVCPWRTPQCTAGCVLTTSGNARYPAVTKARNVRTRFLVEHTAEAVALIAGELRRAVDKRGPIACRLNVASDIRWELVAPALFELPGVSFYDYTKAPRSQRSPGSNYRLTYSVSERSHSDTEAIAYLRDGGTAAVVFATRKGASLPATWRGFPVVDGDVTDDRLSDPPGVVVGLRAKGALRGKPASGFVREGANS